MHSSSLGRPDFQPSAFHAFLELSCHLAFCANCGHPYERNGPVAYQTSISYHLCGETAPKLEANTTRGNEEPDLEAALELRWKPGSRTVRS